VVLRSAVMNPFAGAAIREGGLLGELLATLEREMAALEGGPHGQARPSAAPVGP